MNAKPIVDLTEGRDIVAVIMDIVNELERQRRIARGGLVIAVLALASSVSFALTVILSDLVK